VARLAWSEPDRSQASFEKLYGGGAEFARRPERFGQLAQFRVSQQIDAGRKLEMSRQPSVRDMMFGITGNGSPGQ